MPLILPLFQLFVQSIGARYIRPAISTTTNFISWAPRLAVARLIAKWRSLLTIIVGVILGSGIGALVPLYTTAVAQVGMVQRLEQEPARDSNSQLRISLKPSDFADAGGNVLDRAAVLDSYVRDTINAHVNSGLLDGWVGQIAGYVESTRMGVMVNDEALVGTRTSIIYLDKWENQVRVVDGELPSRAALPEGADFNVAVSLNVANELNLEVGSLITLDQRLDERGNQRSGAYASSRPMVVHIAAVVAPRDEGSSYWMEPNPLGLTSEGVWASQFYLLADKATVESVMADYVPETDTTFGWRIVFDHGRLPYSRISQARSALRTLDTELYQTLKLNTDRDLKYNYYTRLIDFSDTRADVDRGILLDYDKKQELNNVPFALLLLEVGALVIFFLVVTAALVRRGERREISMFQSRGAWDGHILALRGIEALLICVFGAIIAPFIAQQALVVMGPSVAKTDEFPLPLTSNVFLFSSMAAAVTLVALTLTLIPVLRMPLISAGGAALRSTGKQWWQKYYVDVIVAVLALAGLILLIRRDSPLIETNTGEKQVDPLMVLAPALAFFGFGSLALRIFPNVAHFASAVSSRGRGLLNTLASWQLAREPLHYGRITFLLALAIGIGWFATSFQATVRRSQTDQASYLVGADARIYERDTRLNVDRAREPDFYNDNSDVDATSIGYRVNGVNVSTSFNQLLAGDVLAIDSRNFGDVALEKWRSDLGNILIPFNPDDAVVMPSVGEELPFNPAKIGLWARISLTGFAFSDQDLFQPNLQRLRRQVTLRVRLQDEAGTWMIVPLQEVRVEYLRQGLDEPGMESAAHVTSGWVYYEADFSRLNYTPVGKIRLVSVFWDHRSSSNFGEANIRLSLAQMTLIDGQANTTPFEIFKRGNWNYVYDSGAGSDGDVTLGSDLDNLHTDIIYVTFDQVALRTRAGINLNYPDPQPMQAIVSNSMAEENNLEVGGDEPQIITLPNVARTAIQFVPQRTTEYFPSLYNTRPFIIVDVRELMYWINQRPSAQFYPNEVWMNFKDDIKSVGDVNKVLGNLQGGDNTGVINIREVTYAREFDRLETDPLALGLLGLMFLAFIIGLALSIVGLLTYASLTSQARRNEFGVLRALGLSSGRVVWSLIVEQLFVVAVAGVLGSVLGYLLSVFVVPTLAIGTTGEGVVPPFITETEWASVGNFWLIMGIVLAIVFAFSFLLVRQLSLSRTLRLGDE
ncbi:MAG: ABC transporter permease [Chloroflexi bacterium]|nr:ABC transporter permease [Chloroflexota bacterium]